MTRCVEKGPRDLPASFAYLRPTSLDEAFELLAAHPGAAFIGGGTDLLVQARAGLIRPPALISLRGVAELAHITPGTPIRIGGGALIADIEAHEELAAAHPGLCQAARTLGSLQVRNAATLAGNLCNASPCADMAPPLLAAGARVALRGPCGARELDLVDLFVSPGENALYPGEVLVEVRLDPLPAGGRAVFLKQGRVGVDLALVSVAAQVVLGPDGACRDVRLAAGSVAPTPVRLRRTEALLEGRVLTRELLAEARATAAREVQPISDQRAGEGYRRRLCGVLVERALEEARS